MRSALKPFGVEIMDLTAGKTPFKIKYDPAKADLAKMMAALADKGETVKKID